MKPAYLIDTFVILDDGFQFTEAPPEEIGAETFKSCRNPWEVLAHYLYRAQNGEAVDPQALADVMTRNPDPIFWNACSELIGCAAPTKAALDCAKWMSANPSNYERAATIAVNTCSIDAVPILMELYRGTDEEEWPYIATCLSFLLEGKDAGVYHGHDQITVEGYEPGPPIADDDDEQAEDETLHRRQREIYLDQTHKAFDAVRSSGAKIVFGGSPFSLQSIFDDLRTDVYNGEPRYPRMGQRKKLLEAWTGADFRGFFKDGKLDQLAASAILEAMLDEVDFTAYQPDRRYFFGHTIPD